MTYIVLTAPVYFTCTLILTLNPFIALISALGGGIFTIDLGSIASHIGYFFIKDYNIYTYIIVLIVVGLQECLASIFIKFFTPATFISFYICMLRKDNNKSIAINNFFSNAYTKCFIIYNIVGSFIAVTFASYFYSIPIRSQMLEKKYPSIYYMFCRNYLTSGLSILDNDEFLTKPIVYIIAVIGHILSSLIASVYIYLKNKSWTDVLKVNLFLTISSILLAILSYITNSFIMS